MWGDWLAWSDCSVSCDNGQVFRQRAPIKQYQRHGGASCPMENNDDAATNTVEYKECTDMPSCDGDAPAKEAGAFTEWSDWWGDWAADSPYDSNLKCSQPCNGGYQWRKRTTNNFAVNGGTQLGRKVFSDGTIQNGAPLQEFQPCNEAIPCVAEPVNCAFGDWSDWTSCLADKFNTRSRNVQTYAANGGDTCVGPLKEGQSCDLEPQHETPQAILSDWADWSQCSVSCGGGSRHKERTVVEQGILPADHKDLQVLEACNVALCCPECEQDRDCEWDNWQDWSTCTVTCGGGEYTRYRNVETAPQNQGKPCETKDTYQVGTCNEISCSEAQYCIWSEWSGFGECSASCGGGSNTRERSLVLTTTPPAEGETYLVTSAEDLALEIDGLSNELSRVNTALASIAAIAVAGMIAVGSHLMQRRAVVAPLLQE